MDSNNAFDLLKEEMENEEVTIYNILINFLDDNQSKCYSQIAYSNGIDDT